MGNYSKLLANWKLIFVLSYPICLLPIPLVLQSSAGLLLYSLSLVVGLWLTEAIPSPVAGIMPIFLLPLFGIQSQEEVVTEYFKDSGMVFLGGYLLSCAFEYSNLHKRIAVKVMVWSGTSMNLLLLGIMLTTMFLSMWMFNTAAAAMLVPIVLAVLEELYDIGISELFESCEMEEMSKSSVPKNLEEYENRDNAILSQSDPNLEKKEEFDARMQRLRTAFLLGICYASNMGGAGILTGTSPNLIAVNYLDSLDPAVHGNYIFLTFTTWMTFAMVPTILNVLAAWAYLQALFIGLPDKLRFWKNANDIGTDVFGPHLKAKFQTTLNQKYENLGPITTHEIAVGIHFISAVVLWALHDPKIIPGWSQLFEKKVNISTGTMLMGLLLFIIPKNEEFYSSLKAGQLSTVKLEALLDWRFAEQKIPWGLYLLLGGGYALSKGAKSTGVSDWLGEAMYSLSGLPQYGIQLIVLMIIVFMTEIMSNSAMATLAIPILLELSIKLEIHPLFLTFPTAMVCSYAFMLPVATGPNAIIYAASDLKLIDMIKTGFFMNIISVIIVCLCCNFYGDFLFHFSDYRLLS